MFIRVSNERVIAGKMRTPGEVIDVSDADGDQAVRDGFAKATSASAKTKEPVAKTATPKITSAPQPDGMLAPQPTESLQKADPHPAKAPDLKK